MDAPLVTLVRRGFDGTVYRVTLPAPEAMAELLAGDGNGRAWASAHIEGDLSAWSLGYDLPVTTD